MTKSKIEWTGRSDWNPVRGCSRVTEACTNCYAEIMAARFSGPFMWGHGFAKIVKLPGGGIDHRWTGKVELQDDRLLKPLTWRKAGLVFPNSTSDFFHEKLLWSELDKLHAVMALCRHLTFQILTKRPDRSRQYYSDPSWFGRVALAIDALGLPSTFNGNVYEAKRALSHHLPLPNIWLGTSVHDQKSADEFLPQLVATPIALMFASFEPLLGPIDALSYFSAYWTAVNCPQPKADDGSWTGRRLDWVIVGGESGPDARPLRLEWVESLIEQCRDAGVPCFVKQLGAKPQYADGSPVQITDKKGVDATSWPPGLNVREFPRLQVQEEAA